MNAGGYTLIQETPEFREYLRYIKAYVMPTYPGEVHRHHIVPRSMGGQDYPDNLIDLDLDGHVRAHYLLYKGALKVGDATLTKKCQYAYSMLNGLAKTLSTWCVREKAVHEVHYHIEPAERRSVLLCVNEVAYYLYHHYRTASLINAVDISDELVGAAIGWPTRKVAKYRTQLQKANLLRINKIGTGQDTVTRFFVGADIVAQSISVNESTKQLWDSLP